MAVEQPQATESGSNYQMTRYGAGTDERSCKKSCNTAGKRYILLKMTVGKRKITMYRE